MKYLPKILIGTPTYSGKNYCVSQFILNVLDFTYPKNRCEFVIFDNSPTPENARFLTKEYGVKVIWKDFEGLKVNEKLAKTHQMVKEYAVDNGFDYILHLESDVFPQVDVIEELLRTGKSVVGVPYLIGNGGQRHFVTRIFDYHNKDYCSIVNMAHFQQFFFNGEVKRCSTNGLGCTLIKTSSIKSINFRHEENRDEAPDTFFSNDLMQNRISYWVHTGMLAFHYNTEDWGDYVQLVNNKND
jgi:GT2 family glycosyltransferase